MFHFQRMAAQKRGEKQPANLEPVKLKDAPIKDGEEPTNRRQALTVEYGSGRSETVTNSAGVSMTHDMSLFDCPWSGALHSYLDLSAPFAVDGGLCLPYQEIPFPFSVGIAPVANGAPFPNLVTPSPNWDPDFAVCRVSASDIGSGFPGGPVTPCSYPGDDATHGGPTGIAENYGTAAGNPGWVNLDGSVQITPDDAFNTPICKTYVSDCKYSKKATRAYTYGAEASMTEAGQGYDINWVLSEVGAIRNSLGADTVMATDLGVPGWTFPTTVYTDLYGLPAGTKPPTSGHYPHAFTKGQWLADGSAVDPSKDGECTVEDAMPQWMDCGIPCPVTEEARMAPEELTGFSVVVVAFMFLCAIIGAVTYFMVGKSSVKFFVGGRNLNLFVMTATIASQSLDANAALGNIDLGYNYHWWDGACLPLGLGGALLLNGIFFAKPINEMKLLTLPDLFARTFGPATEVLFSFLAILSFLMLLGGNLVGVGKMLRYLFGLPNEWAGIAICAFAIWLYTVAGGLLSVAYTDCVQAIIGWAGLVVGTIWILNNMPSAAGVSAAYPLGDVTNMGEQMTDADALDPIPNAITFNWVTIFVLAFGNLPALDFQARIMAAKTGNTARLGCILGAFISWIVGITFSYTSGAARALYGPSSPYAEFVADSCSADITVIGCFGGGGSCGATVLPGVPTCGEWKPDPMAPLRMLTCTKEKCHYFLDFDGSGLGGDPLQDGFFPMSPFIGGWILVSIVAASMSTGDGAILAMSTVFSHNVLRKLPFPWFKEDKNLLTMARLSTMIWAPLAILIAGSSPDQTGYFLIVAFDIMLAGSVIPMFAAVYWKSCKPIAAFIAMFGGSLLRLILEFTLPKDGLLLLVGKYARSFGPGSYGGLNVETGAPLDGWCPQYMLKDFTGIDSIAAPFFSLLLLLVCQILPTPKHWLFEKVEPPEEEKEGIEMSTTASA